MTAQLSFFQYFYNYDTIEGKIRVFNVDKQGV